MNVQQNEYFTADNYRFFEPIMDSAGEVVGDTEHVWSRERILKEYFPYWKSRMIEVEKEELISEENCVIDWIIMNWAEPVTVH